MPNILDKMMDAYYTVAAKGPSRPDTYYLSPRNMADLEQALLESNTMYGRSVEGAGVDVVRFNGMDVVAVPEMGNDSICLVNTNEVGDHFQNGYSYSLGSRKTESAWEKLRE